MAAPPAADIGTWPSSSPRVQVLSGASVTSHLTLADFDVGELVLAGGHALFEPLDPAPCARVLA